MNLKKLITDYLKTARVMQLATSVNNQPWACNVHFFADEDFNFYWSSTPQRRHSIEIEQNPNVAIAVKIHEDTPDGKYVIGISAEGTAELIDSKLLEKIRSEYTEKNAPTLVLDILEGKDPHRTYRLRATRIVLFDNKNFPDNPRQEYKV